MDYRVRCRDIRKKERGASCCERRSRWLFWSSAFRRRWASRRRPPRRMWALPDRRPTASSSTWRTASSATAPKGMSCPTSISVTAASAAPRPIPSWSASSCAAFRTPRCRRSNFSEAQAAAIVQFLRAKALRAAATAGNAANGRAIFTGKGNCASCHRVNGTGSRLGPDLSDIGRLRHSTDIERAIVEPDFLIVPSNRFVRLVTRDGATVTGRLLNQDIFTVQLLDSKEQLRSLHARRPQGVHVHRQVADAVVSRQAEPAGDDRSGRAIWFRCKGRCAMKGTHGSGRSLLVACCVAARVAAGAGDVRSPRARVAGAAQLAVVLGRLLQPALQRAHADYAGEREEPGVRVDLPAELARADEHALRSDAGRRRRHHVHRPAAERHHRARRGHRPSVLDVLVQPVAAVAPVLRPRESRRRDSRRPAVHGHDRRPHGGGRREDRQAALGQDGRQTRGGLRVRRGAARRQRQSHHGPGRRRVRHSRVSRGVRRGDRQGSVALQSRFPAPANPASKRGRAIRGKPAAPRSG